MVRLNTFDAQRHHQNLKWKNIKRVINNVGESSRSLHYRLSEHLRFATSPDNRSYMDEAFAVHYRQYHHGQVPQLSFKLLKSECNTVSRKIIEAMYINQLKPEVNDKEECISINRFLVKN